MEYGPRCLEIVMYKYTAHPDIVKQYDRAVYIKWAPDKFLERKFFTILLQSNRIYDPAILDAMVKNYLKFEFYSEQLRIFVPLQGYGLPASLFKCEKIK